MRGVLRTLLRMAPSVGGASALAVAGVWLSRQVLDPATLAASNNEVGNYIQALGSIYAVVAAFVIYVVWGQFNDARGQIEKEAAELVDLYRLADGFPDESRRELQAKLRDYADTVLDSELAAIAACDHGPLEHTSELLDGVWDVLHRCEPMSECHKSLHAEALSRYNELSDVRTARLTSARTRIPLGLRMLLYIGAVILVGSMYLIAIERFWIHALITAALAAAVAHILYIVEDLDDPFAGYWQVPRDAFARARDYMRKRQDKKLTTPCDADASEAA
jgi:hypothetical protein